MEDVLIIGGEGDFAETLKAGLDALAIHEVQYAKDDLQALRILMEEEISTVVMDTTSPAIDCFEIIAYLSRAHPSLPLILISGDQKPWFHNKKAAVSLGRHDCGQRGTDRGKKSGGKNSGRIIGACGGPKGNHPGGQQGYAGGVDGKEKRHGVGGCSGAPVKFVKLLHRPNSKRRSSITQSHGVGRNVQYHGSHGGMFWWYIRK